MKKLMVMCAMSAILRLGANDAQAQSQEPVATPDQETSQDSCSRFERLISRRPTGDPAADQQQERDVQQTAERAVQEARVRGDGNCMALVAATRLANGGGCTAGLALAREAVRSGIGRDLPRCVAAIAWACETMDHARQHIERDGLAACGLRASERNLADLLVRCSAAVNWRRAALATARDMSDVCRDDGGTLLSVVHGLAQQLADVQNRTVRAAMGGVSPINVSSHGGVAGARMNEVDASDIAPELTYIREGELRRQSASDATTTLRAANSGEMGPADPEIHRLRPRARSMLETLTVQGRLPDNGAVTHLVLALVRLDGLVAEISPELQGAIYADLTWLLRVGAFEQPRNTRTLVHVPLGNRAVAGTARADLVALRDGICALGTPPGELACLRLSTTLAASAPGRCAQARAYLDAMERFDAQGVAGRLGRDVGREVVEMTWEDVAARTESAANACSEGGGGMAERARGLRDGLWRQQVQGEYR